MESRCRQRPPDPTSLEREKGKGGGKKKVKCVMREKIGEKRTV